MQIIGIVALLLSLCLFSRSSQLVIVYVHTTIPGSCGPLPDHLKASLLQAHRNSVNGTLAKVVILGNFKQCRWALDDIKNGGDPELSLITTAESMGIKSSATLEWEKLLRNIVPKGTTNEDLLLTSLYRYFMLNDYMTYSNIEGHVLHLDSDTMLYGNIASMATSLAAGYPRLGLAPSIHKRFLSATTMYIGSRAALRKMNSFFTSLVSNSSSSSGAAVLTGYATWLRTFSCCRPVSQGGMLSHNGVDGVRPWAVNDMTMLAYYRMKHHGEIKLFPILPSGLSSPAADQKLRRGGPQDKDMGSHSHSSTAGAASSTSDLAGGYLSGQLAAPTDHHLPLTAIKHYSVGGSEVGPDVGGLLDCSGGWGMHLQENDGNSSTHAATLRAADRHIIVEQAVVRHGCKVAFKCTQSSNGACSTAPHVACSDTPNDVPLLTLHLNSKNRGAASTLLAVPCVCP